MTRGNTTALLKLILVSCILERNEMIEIGEIKFHFKRKVLPGY